MSAGGGRDPYEARREAGRASRTQTQQRLLAAADALFRVRGYAATPVTAIADGAGVSLQTLYLAWGSKRALLQAATEAAASGSSTPLDADAWHEAVHQAVRRAVREEAAGALGEQERASAYLRGLAAVFAAVAQRTADYWRINQDAAASDPELAPSWQQLLHDRRSTMAALVRRMPGAGLRPGLDLDAIVDTLWAVASPDSYVLLTRVGHASEDDYTAWLAHVLVTTLTTDAPAGSPEEAQLL